MAAHILMVTYDADAWDAIRTQLDLYPDPRPEWMRS